MICIIILTVTGIIMMMNKMTGILTVILTTTMIMYGITMSEAAILRWTDTMRVMHGILMIRRIIRITSRRATTMTILMTMMTTAGTATIGMTGTAMIPTGTAIGK